MVTTLNLRWDGAKKLVLPYMFCLRCVAFLKCQLFNMFDLINTHIYTLHLVMENSRLELTFENIHATFFPFLHEVLDGSPHLRGALCKQVAPVVECEVVKWDGWSSTPNARALHLDKCLELSSTDTQNKDRLKKKHFHLKKNQFFSLNLHMFF